MRYSSDGHRSDENDTAEQERWQRRFSAPENELPSPVPVAAILGRSTDVVVAIVGVQAYTTGLTFDVAVRMRTEPRGALRFRLHHLIGGHWHGEDVTADQLLLLGVQYGDERTATNLGPRRWRPDMEGEERDEPTDEQLILSISGGGGGDRTHDRTFWLSPLPPPGPVTFVCAWSAFGIAETHTVVDGTQIAEAGSRAEVLWPWEPERDHRDEPREPPMPSTGWFADVMRRRGVR